MIVGLAILGSILLLSGALRVLFHGALAHRVSEPQQHFAGPMLGRVIGWEKDYVSVALMGRGPAEAWLADASYDDQRVLPKVAAPRQIWAEPREAAALSLCLVFWPANCVEPIAMPYHRHVDTWTPKPSEPWTEPEPDDLADSAVVRVAAARGGGWDVLRYPGE